MQVIIGMPPHIIIIGMPMFIMAIMRSQAIFIMSMVMPSPGVILQTIPVGVISQVIMQVMVGMPMFMGICIIMGMFIGMPMFIGICMGIGMGICIAVIMILFPLGSV